MKLRKELSDLLETLEMGGEIYQSDLPMGLEIPFLDHQIETLSAAARKELEKRTRISEARKAKRLSQPHIV